MFHKLAQDATQECRPGPDGWECLSSRALLGWHAHAAAGCPDTRSCCLCFLHLAGYERSPSPSNVVTYNNCATHFCSALISALCEGCEVIASSQSTNSIVLAGLTGGCSMSPKQHFNSSPFSLKLRWLILMVLCGSSPVTASAVAGWLESSFINTVSTNERS